MVGVYAGGSWALGDYHPGRSDLDVAVVVAGALTGAAADRIVAGMSHDALPCPARGLELVVYTSAAAASGATDPAFELNFNTGAAIETRIDRDPEVEDAQWFAIDRAILAQGGIALRGPPPADLFNPPPREGLLELLAASIRWQEERAATPDAVLNACRALRYARTGQWTSKSVAGEWALDALGATEIVGAALASRRGDRDADLDQLAARSFLQDSGRALVAPPR